MEENQVREHLDKLDLYMSMDPGDVAMNAEGAGPCHCKATLGYFGKVVMTGGGS